MEFRYEQLYYLEEHDIICKYQSGFRAIHSTLTALLQARDTWAYNIDHGKINAVVFLDLKKALDTVDSVLSFDQINFFNMANLFSLSRKAFFMCYCFRAPIKTFFFDTCQMTVKSCVLHLFPVPQTGRSHIINILLALFFRSVL